jgi:hypothetical protein
VKTALTRRFKLLLVLATVLVVGSFGIGSGSSAFGATSYPPFTDPMLLVNWNVDASTHIKKLNQDVTVPRGSFVGLIDLKTGSILGLLTLPPAHMSLKALGLLPLVQADFQMAPVGPITGQVDLTKLVVTSTATFNIKITKLTAAGLPANLVGNSCTTATPITVTMGGPVSLTSGSTFTGVYTIPPFATCGALTPALTAAISGPGNTFTGTFSPKS